MAEKKKRKRDYILDSEAGIRRLDQLKRLNVLELTDEEHLKVFMDRFGAQCIALMYYDEESRRHLFGRLRSGSSVLSSCPMSYPEATAHINEINVTSYETVTRDLVISYSRKADQFDRLFYYTNKYCL